MKKSRHERPPKVRGGNHNPDKSLPGGKYHGQIGRKKKKPKSTDGGNQNK